MLLLRARTNEQHAFEASFGAVHSSPLAMRDVVTNGAELMQALKRERKSSSRPDRFLCPRPGPSPDPDKEISTIRLFR
jgi:hypothetical protein